MDISYLSYNLALLLVIPSKHSVSGGGGELKSEAYFEVSYLLQVEDNVKGLTFG